MSRRWACVSRLSVVGHPQCYSFTCKRALFLIRYTESTPQRGNLSFNKTLRLFFNQLSKRLMTPNARLLWFTICQQPLLPGDVPEIINRAFLLSRYVCKNHNTGFPPEETVAQIPTRLILWHIYLFDCVHRIHTCYLFQRKVPLLFSTEDSFFLFIFFMIRLTGWSRRRKHTTVMYLHEAKLFIGVKTKANFLVGF